MHLGESLELGDRVELVNILNAKVLLENKYFPLYRAITRTIWSLAKAIETGENYLELPTFSKESNGREIYENPMMFDMPTKTKEQRKAGSQFRQRLLKEGFFYVAIFCICKDLQGSKKCTDLYEKIGKFFTTKRAYSRHNAYRKTI